MTLPAGFRGIVPPVCTPFTKEFEVDIPSLKRLLQFQIDAGVDGLFMLGSSSETSLLTNGQKKRILETAVEVANGKVPVLAGVIDMATARSLEQAQTAKSIGVDALVLTAPFYARTGPEETKTHYRTIRSKVDLPIFAYDIPSTTNVKLDRKIVIELAKEGTIAAIKDSSGDESNFRGLVLEAREIPSFSVFTGSELIVDLVLLEGAHGAVPGLANVDPAGYVKIYNAVKTGDIETARLEQERLYKLFLFVYAGIGIKPEMGFTASALGAFKTGLMLRGVIDTNIMGQPFTTLNDDQIAKVREFVAAAGLL